MAKIINYKTKETIIEKEKTKLTDYLPIINDDDSVRKLAEEAVMNGISLDYAYLKSADLTRGHFEDASFSHACLSDADLRDTLFSNCNFFWANFRNALFYDVSFSNCNFAHADLRGVSFGSSVFFHNCNFNGVYFKGTNLRGARFHNCTLDHTKISQDQVDDLLKAIDIEII